MERKGRELGICGVSVYIHITCEICYHHTWRLLLFMCMLISSFLWLEWQMRSCQILVARTLSRCRSLSPSPFLFLCLSLSLSFLLSSFAYDIASIITFAPPRAHHVDPLDLRLDVGLFRRMGMWTPPRNLTDASLHPAPGHDIGSSRSQAASAATETIHHLLRMCTVPYVHY